MILASAAQMREADRRTIEEIGLPGVALMENAAQGAARVLAEVAGQVEDLDLAALCGRGNNGGDGLAALRILAGRGARATAYLFCRVKDLTGDAALNCRVALQCGVNVIEVPDEAAFREWQPAMAGHEFYLDALLGTGLNTPVAGRHAAAIELLNSLPAPVLALDIPSGLSADTGRPLGPAVQADHTVTFGLVKRGLVLDPDDHAGRIHLVDISIPPQVVDELEIDCLLLEADAAAAFLNPRPAGGHKGAFGHLLVVGGSPGKSGAACLAAMGGLRAGAGLVTLGLPAGLNPVAEVKLTAAMSQPLAEDEEGGLAAASLDAVLELMHGREALVLGPGLGQGPGAAHLARGLATLLERPLVIDADGLNALAGDFKGLAFASPALVLTPHPGEAARLLGKSVPEVQADRLAAAKAIARLAGCVCVLKGARTVIAEPGGRAWVNVTGNALLASGGTGDVLAGVIGGLLAQGMGPEEAACSGVFAHGLAADLAAADFGRRGLEASELCGYLPKAFAALEGGAGPEAEPPAGPGPAGLAPRGLSW